MIPEALYAIPAGKLNFELVPVPSKNCALPSPVNIEDETRGDENLNALVTASEAAVREEDDAAAPHARTTLEGFTVDKTVGAHLTHALTVNAEDPVESAGTDVVDTNDPLARTMAVLGN
jgi:hypothetical protein